jgi:uncharacterized protein (DUF1499 family)
VWSTLNATARLNALDPLASFGGAPRGGGGGNARARGERAAPPADPPPTSSRLPPLSDFVLNSANVAVLASLFNWGSTPRPSGLGPREINGTKALSLCPSTPNCISTAEEANDEKHYVPQWSFNPPARKGGKKTMAEAMADLVAVTTAGAVEGFTPQIVTQTDDYLYLEFTSPTFGFVDDVEFLLKENSEVEYRSASRIGESDGDANRKRIRALRKALEPRGWKSIAAFE